MKKSVLISLLLFAAGVVGVFGEDIPVVTFGYDSAGNRVSRVLTFVTEVSQLRAEESEVEAPVYEEMLSEMIIKIAPNPTEGLLRVTLENLPEETAAQILLYNLKGQLITSRKDIRDSAELNITNQPAGLYVLRILAGEKQTEWKIIKK